MTKRPIAPKRRPRPQGPKLSPAPGSDRSRLSPELRNQFHRLLLTWSDQSRGRRVPWRELSTRLDKEWADREKVFLEFEERFGIGHYDDRRRRLDATLDALDGEPHVDFPAILAALWEARETRMEATREGREIDFRRMISAHQRLIKDLRHRLHQSEESYLTLLDYHGPGASEALDALYDWEKFLDLINRLRRLRWGLEHDPLFEADAAGPLRRSKAGRRSTPWLVHLRAQLRHAGVDDPEDTLLIAAGLVPYPPAPTH